MEIKTFVETLRTDERLSDLILENSKTINKINSTHAEIKRKYQEETKSEFRDENIVNKNLIVYLLIKNGVSLTRPTQISGSKYVININSKKLIMNNKSMHIDFDHFLTTLQNLSDQKVKDAVKDYKIYHNTVLSTSNYNGKIYHQRFTEKFESENTLVQLDFSVESDYNKQRYIYSFYDKPATNNAGRITMTINLDMTVYSEFDFSDKFFSLKDEQIILASTNIKTELYNKVSLYNDTLKKYLSLLNEFQLV